MGKRDHVKIFMAENQLDSCTSNSKEYCRRRARSLYVQYFTTVTTIAGVRNPIDDLVCPGLLEWEPEIRLCLPFLAKTEAHNLLKVS